MRGRMVRLSEIGPLGDYLTNQTALYGHLYLESKTMMSKTLEHSTGNPCGDFSGCGEVADFTDDSKFSGIGRNYDSRPSVTADRVQNLFGDIRRALCADIFHDLNIALQSIDRFLDAVERLSGSQPPIIFVQKEPTVYSTGPFVSGKKQRESAASNVANTVHMHRHGQPTNEIV